MTRGGKVAVAGLLVACALGAYVATRMEVTTDITQFLPSGEDRELVELARQITVSELSRTMVLVVGAPEGPDAEATVVAASRVMEAALRADPHLLEQLAFLEGGPPDGVDSALWELYHPRRFGFVAEDADTARARTTDAALREAAVRLELRLASPMSTLLSRIAPSDPLLILPDLFDRMAGSRADGLAIVDGRFIARDARHAVLFLGTKAQAFDSEAQRIVLDAVQAAFARAQSEVSADLTLMQSGANRFAVRAEAAIKEDIMRVSTLSLLGLFVLFFILFRSLRLVALTALPIGAGMLVGCAGCIALFGQINGLTLAFGSALIGVSIDYTEHYYCHHTLDPAPEGPARTMRRIWPGLVLATATTIVGFLTLALSSLPGLRELAVFGALGLVGALFATRVFLPPLMPRVPRPAPAARRFAMWLLAGVTAMRRRRWIPWTILAAALTLTAVGLPGVRWEDDIARLGSLDPALMAEDEAVREQVVRYEQRRFVVAVGDDEEAALAVNDAVAPALAQATAAGDIGGYRSIGQILPSAARQARVREAFTGAPRLGERLSQAFTAEGFRPLAFAPFEAALAADAPAPLTWQDLVTSPLAPFVRSFRVGLGDRVGILSFLHDVREPGALAARLEALVSERGQAHLVDVGALLAGGYARYRVGMLELLLAGVAAVLLLVVLRYRDLRRTAAAFIPALVAAGVTVAVLTLAGVALNVLSLTALLMVVSMGDDYGVFLVEAVGDGPTMPATLLSLVVACVTTVLGFGLLGLSDHPALSSLGLTAGIGVIAGLVIAPSVLVLTRAQEGK